MSDRGDDLVGRIAKLEEENRRLVAMLSNADSQDDARTVYGLNAVVIQIDAEYRVIYVNHTFEQWFGRHRSQVEGRLLSEVEDMVELNLGFMFALRQARRAGGNYSTGFAVSRTIGETARYLKLTVTTLSNGRAEFLLEDQSQLKLLESTFRKYVSSNIIDELVKNNYNPMVARRQEVTILFADLRGFTALCSHNPPFMVKRIIDEFLSEMMRIIVEHDATVDKIIGDEVMALFGAPIPHDHHGLRAVEVAVEMQQAHAKLMQGWQNRGMPAPQLGIGINTGEVIVGNIGSEIQMSYTVLGHAVNVAHRLCSAAHGGQILISNGTLDEVKDVLQRDPSSARRSLKFRRGQEIQVRGVDAPLTTITVCTE